MDKENVIKLNNLLNEKRELEREVENDEVIKSNPWAVNEGYSSEAMDKIREIDKKIELIK